MAAAASGTPPPAQMQTKQETSNASLLRNPSKVIVLRVSSLFTVCGNSCPLSCVNVEACLTGWPNA